MSGGPEDGNQFPDFRCDDPACERGEAPCRKHMPGVADLRKALADVISKVPCGDFEHGEDVDNNEGIADAVLSAFHVTPKAKGDK